ncbi:tyrosine-type recombinase/integrase [Candidatus Mycoplasma mahonii]|uniref:tyrosine-type recombinase/integrase n=1 Tax=Candidatus Mycoplasma mahonii TaxID=3004105 RepID=UPI0026F2866A|nr:site-specific integrase [Candidatus Mycoplasma mahonii]WKX02761.1 site-specific integrase [Candidatus Mycoplasma mahonii]
MKYTNWLKNIKGYSDKTIEVYGRYIFELEICENDWEKLIEKYSNKSNSTKRIVLSAVKSYYSFKSDKRAGDITLPKKNITKSDYVTYDQYRKYIFSINKRSKMGFQKYLILRILFETGIRSSELLWITQSSIQGNRIKIRGKGNKERYVIVSEWLKTEIAEYIKTIQTEKLFTFGYKNLYMKIQRVDKNRNLSPHMFRHGFARYCNSQGISIYDISLSMGHSSIDTTAKYVNKNSEDVMIHTIF